MTEALGSVRQTLQQIRTQIPNFGTFKCFQNRFYNQIKRNFTEGRQGLYNSLDIFLQFVSKY